MKIVTFADIVHESLNFDQSTNPGKLILKLIDTPWVQRLRDISQTANTKLVYMFSEHSRFGHSLGVAYLAIQLMDKLEREYPKKVSPWKNAVAAAALLHDIAHLAPGSHTAQKAWFPGQPDIHEEISAKIIQEEKSINSILEKTEKGLADKVCRILREDKTLPPWTWQILSGGIWNVDRGNWCMADSILAGVSYGKYNITALTNSITLDKKDSLAVSDNRLDALLHFVVSRHAMYRQVYQHRVMMGCDRLTQLLIKRLRELPGGPEFMDQAMIEALLSKTYRDLSLNSIFEMRESWWRYHLMRFQNSRDPILRDLSQRLVNRDLFKTVAVLNNDNFDALYKKAERAVTKAGYDPRYYLSVIETSDMIKGESAKSLKVITEDGQVQDLSKVHPFFRGLLKESKEYWKKWLIMPAEAKRILGRSR